MSQHGDADGAGVSTPTRRRVLELSAIGLAGLAGGAATAGASGTGYDWQGYETRLADRYNPTEAEIAVELLRQYTDGTKPLTDAEFDAFQDDVVEHDGTPQLTADIREARAQDSPFAVSPPDGETILADAIQTVSVERRESNTYDWYGTSCREDRIGLAYTECNAGRGSHEALAAAHLGGQATAWATATSEVIDVQDFDPPDEDPDGDGEAEKDVYFEVAVDWNIKGRVRGGGSVAANLYLLKDGQEARTEELLVAEAPDYYDEGGTATLFTELSEDVHTQLKIELLTDAEGTLPCIDPNNPGCIGNMADFKTDNLGLNFSNITATLMVDSDPDSESDEVSVESGTRD